MPGVNLRFQVQRLGTEFCVMRFKEEKEDVFYKIPAHLQLKSKHTELFTYIEVSRTEEACPNDENYRHVWVEMSEQHARLYRDKSGNAVFKDQSLEADDNQTEKIQKKNSAAKESTEALSQQLILKMMRTLEARLDESNAASKADVAKKFGLSKFDGADEASSWLEKFEAECERLAVDGDAKRIEMLGKMMKPESKAQDWYENCKKALPRSSLWTSWTFAFKNVFVPKNWVPVREAHSFKYTGDPLLDYSLAKEKRMLNADPTASQKSVINAIVIGLPEIIQDQLIRKDIVSVIDLQSKLASLSVPDEHKKRDGLKGGRNGKHKQRSESNPCSYCKKKLGVNRYHRLEDCWTKQKDERESGSREKKKKTTKAEANLAKLDEPQVLSSENSDSDASLNV